MKTVWALAFALIAGGGGAAPSIPDILPGETPALVGTPNATALREGFQQSPHFRLWEDAAVQAFVAPLVQRINERLATRQGPMAISLDEFFHLFPGQIYGGVIRATAQNGGLDVGGFFAAETTNPQRVTEIVDAMITDAGAQQARDSYTVQDVTVSRNVLTFAQEVEIPGQPEGQEPGIPGAQTERTLTMHTAVVDGLILITIDEPLNAVITNLRGGGTGGFAQGPSYQSTLAMAHNPAYQLIMHLNPATVAGALDQIVPEDAPVNVAAAGLGDFQGFSVWLNFGAEQEESWYALSVAPNPTGLGRLFRHGSTSDFPALDWVPESAATFSAMSYDVGAAATDLLGLVTTVSPLLGGMVTSVLPTANQSLGFDIMADLVTQIGPEIVSYSVINDAAAAPAGGTAPVDNGAEVYILGLHDASRVETALSRLAQPAVVGANQTSGTGMLEAQEFGGQTFYTPPAVFNTPGGGAAVLPAFALISDHLVFASTAEEMRSVISASQGQIEGSVRQGSRWADIQAQALPGANAFSYSDDAAVMAGAMGLFQQMSLISMFNPNFSLPLDLARVPGRDVFERYLTHTITSSAISANGVVGHASSPNVR